MILEMDKEIILRQLRCNYLIVSQHRNLAYAKNKSQWQISMQEEINCFKESKIEEWTSGDQGWGLKLGSNQRLEVVGINFHNDQLKIAKFVGKNNIWHGYPADYIRNSQDRPDVGVLGAWKDKGIISKHHMAKIRGGKRCNL